MFEGQPCRMRKTEDGWEVEIGPDRWHAFSNRLDAELVGSAGQLFCDPRPTTKMLQATIKAIERAGIAQDADVLVVYDQLVQKLRKRKPKK